MLRTFTEGSLKQDVWRGHDFWQPMIWSFDELTDVKNNLDSGINEEEFPTFLDYCNNVVWHRLTNLSSMYEELVREWYLPTMLAQLTSYPEVGTIIKIDE